MATVTGVEVSNLLKNEVGTAFFPKTLMGERPFYSTCKQIACLGSSKSLYSRIICCPNSFLLKQLHFAWNN